MPERLPPRGAPPGPQREPAAPDRARPAAGQFDLFGKRSQERIYSVGELTVELKRLIEGRFIGMLVKGEVSNVRQPSSGHVYFTLKDSDACIDAVLFRNEARRLRFAVRAGLMVLVRGRLSLYEPQGRYELICDTLEPAGAGALQIAYEQLKQRLNEEGLFDKARKRPLPYLPRRVALVTSPSGAVVHDFLRVLHRRFPNLPVLVVPAKVQGDGAAQEIARGIARAASQPLVDVVVVARGGGSLEDLWAFNEEVVARALAACPVPTVSAVGHETDVTISDFAADVRASTPTAAAELVARVKDELTADLAQRRARLVRAVRALAEKRRSALEARRSRVADPRRLIGERRLRLDRLEQRLSQALQARLEDRAKTLGALTGRLDRAHPRAQLLRLERAVAQLEERLTAAARRQLAQRHKKFEALAGKLDALSPLKVLARGYAVVFGKDGHALHRAAEAQPGDPLRVRLHDGELDAVVTSGNKR
jgi:exodeoxyribonuclease VII large subunit